MRFSIPEAQLALQNSKVALSALLRSISEIVRLRIYFVSFRVIKTRVLSIRKYQKVIAVVECDRPIEISEEDDLGIGLHVRKARGAHGEQSDRKMEEGLGMAIEERFYIR